MGKTFRMPPIAPKLVVKPPRVDFVSGGDASDVSVTAQGLQALVETLESMPKVYRDAAGYEMADIANEVIEYAKEHYVPLRWGPLKDSGDSDEYRPETEAKVIDIAMWFGAPQSGHIETSSKHGLAQTEFRQLREEGLTKHADPSEYALEQHENMRYEHFPPPDETGPKYLERALTKFQPQILPRLAKAAGIALGTGYGSEVE